MRHSLYHSLYQRMIAYGQLMRLDKPIGTFLLLWPTLWGLWVAGAGQPPRSIVVIFVLGVFLMRSAGCVINDIADRHIDGHVERTRHRPLARGAVSTAEALSLFVLLLLLAGALLWSLNALTKWLALPAALLAASYPFAKRYHSLPQAHLGLAFSFSIPMAFAAIQGGVPPIAWLLMLINVLWVIVYDTEYAMSDREDDLKIGVKSSAILFGQYDRAIIGALQACVIGLLIVLGMVEHLGAIFMFSIIVVQLLFAYHQWLIAARLSASCFRAFLHNSWVGLTIFLGLLLAYLPAN